MDRELLAYLAGCMDSDGYFGIRRDCRAMKADSRTPTHVAIVILKQVTPQVPTLLHQLFGGQLRVDKPSALNGRPLINWNATAVKASTACESLLPFLRIKKKQAQLLIDLQARKGSIRIKGFPGTPRLPDEEVAARDELWNLVKSMNKVGA